MQPHIYEKRERAGTSQYQNKLTMRVDNIPIVSSHCLNETNTIKHCLRRKNLSVIANSDTWEKECATNDFYRHCRGKEQLHMVENMWLDEFNNRLYTKQGLARYNKEGLNNREHAFYF